MRLKLIDKYIIFKFLSTVGFVILLINSIITVIDYGEKSDNFMKPEISLQAIIFDYYVNFWLHLTNMLSPITVFIATVFVTAQLAARTEIVAILASGVSFSRLLVPYLGGASLLAIISFGATGWIIPHANKTRVDFDNTYIKGKYIYNQRDVHFKVAPNTFVYFQNYNNAAHIGYSFTMEKIINNQLVEKLTAPQISWDTLKQIWHIAEYKTHRFDGEQEKIETGRNMDTVLSLTFKDFETTHLLHEALTLPELDEYIELQTARGNTNLGVFYVEKYERYTNPFAMVVLTFMGVIISAKKSRQGIGMQIALGFLIAFAFFIFVRLARSLGQAGSIEPLIAAFIPITVFAIITLIMNKLISK